MPVISPPAMPTLWATSVVVAPLILALLVVFWQWDHSLHGGAVGLPGPIWSSSATVVTALSALLNGAAIAVARNNTSLLNPQEYSLLIIVFPALVLLAVLLVACYTSGGAASNALLFLATVVALWCAQAELLLLLLQFLELRLAHVLSTASAISFAALPIALFPALFLRLREYTRTPASESGAQWNLL